MSATATIRALRPGATRFEARAFLAGLAHGQRVQLSIDGRTATYEVSRTLGRSDVGGEHPDSHGVTFRAATGTRSYCRRVTIAQVSAGFAPTILDGPEAEVVMLPTWPSDPDAA